MRLIQPVLQSRDIPVPVLYQVEKDLRIYNTYDALCMWLDHENGLAAYCPEEILDIGRSLVSYAEKKGENGITRLLS